MRQDSEDYGYYRAPYNPEFLERIHRREREAKARKARREAEKWCAARVEGTPQRVNDVINEIAAKHLVPVPVLLGNGRTRVIIEAKREACYELKARFQWASWAQIGKWLGRDHTTVIHGAAMHATRHGLPAVTSHDIIAKRAKYHRTARAA